MRAPERFETPRLVLRKPSLDDAESVFSRYANDPEVTRFLSWARHLSVDETRAFLAFSDAEWERWPAGPYLVESRENGRLLGGAGFGFEAVDRASTGYVFARDAWGQGYATEALRGTVEIARQIGLARLDATCHVDHRASWRVLEKCGFAREALLRQHSAFPNLDAERLYDVFAYTLVLGSVLA